MDQASRHPGIARPSGGDVAIIGMACTFPLARDVRRFWNNIVQGVDAIREVSPDRWDPKVFFDPKPGMEDKVYCKRGGYLDNTFAFNPLRFGTMPRAVQGAEPDQFIVLRCAHEALEDAGYADRFADSERTSFILGRGNYLGVGLTGLLQRGMMAEQTIQILRTLHPEYSGDELERIRRAIRDHVPAFGAEQAPGLIPNISSGRVANRFGLMGPNFTVDAACASSLVAADVAVRGLLCGQHDLAMIGGVHVFSDVPFLQVFAAMGALSHTSVIRPFDRNADGTMAGEGVGILVLKRLSDAKRDDDHIYATIKAVGTSSDGRAKSVTAPRVEGEVLALQRAYAAAGIDPRSVGLIEAHGTATPVGDEAEIEALQRVLGPRASGPPTTALGSIKSMIGHTMPAAGSAGLIKAALSLHHKLLPPSLHCDEPAATLLRPDSRLYVNTRTRPWIHGDSSSPRRAGVNAFGFGGVNAHVILEEYVPPVRGRSQVAVVDRSGPPAAQPGVASDGGFEAIPSYPIVPSLHERESEVFILEAETRAELVKAAERLREYLASAEGVRLIDIAFTLNTGLTGKACRLAIVAETLADLAEKLSRAGRRLRDADGSRINDAKGVYYLSESEQRGGKVAFLFPGEGAQYVDMLAGLCLEFEVVRQRFDAADRAVTSPNRYPPSLDIFPPPGLTEEERLASEANLWRIERAVEAVLTADGAMLTLLRQLGVEPDFITGHSGGEWVASVAAGLFDVDDFIASMPRLDQMYRDLAADTAIPPMTMLAVGAGEKRVRQLAAAAGRPVEIANDNCPHQVVVVVAPEDADAVTARLRQEKVLVERLPYDRGYHTPAFTYICEPLRAYFASLALSPAKVPIYSCTTAAPYPADRAGILEILANTFARPLQFRETIQAMYDAGTRIFVEVGPRANLCGFVDDILRGRPHVTIPTNHHRRPAVTTLNHAIARLAGLHVPLDLGYLYRHRDPRRLTFDPSADCVQHPDDAPGTLHISLCYPHLKLDPADVPELRATASPAPQQPVAAAAERPSGMEEVGRAGQTALNRQKASGDDRPAPSERPEPGAAPRTATAVEAELRSSVDEAEPAGSGHDHGSFEAGGDIDAVMFNHMQLMEQALATHEQVMQACLASAEEPALGETAGNDAAGGEFEQAAIPDAESIPFAGEIVEFEAGRRIVLVRPLDLDEDLYLLDHHFDPKVTEIDPGRDTLNVVPMTVSVEMMAEAAALLAPGERVIGIRQVQAARWIDVERSGPPVSIRITAWREPGDGAIRAAVHREAGEKEDRSDAPIAEATVLVSHAFPAAPAMKPGPLRSERTPSHTAEEMYSHHRMFHGPRFQGVVGLDTIGDDGLRATLEVLPTDNLLRSRRDPRFHVDPFLLDAAGQLVGYWPVEYLNEGFVLFPIRLEELILYRENLAPGRRAICDLRVRVVEHRRFVADMDIVDAESGELWMRIIGWEDWRFHWPRSFYDFWRFPSRYVASEPLAMPGGEEVEFRRMASEGELRGALWEKLWAYLVCSRRELAEFQSLPEGPRRTEWIVGRSVAKDAVRVWLERRFGLKLYPADIEIDHDERGRPYATGSWAERVPQVPTLSIAHKGRVAVAAAGAGHIGVDIEQVETRGNGFAEAAFQAEELTRMPPEEGTSDGEWITRAWAAKEAAGKALGVGLSHNPHSLIIVRAETSGEFAIQPSGSGNGVLRVQTRRDGPYVVALTVQEQDSHVTARA